MLSMPAIENALALGLGAYTVVRCMRREANAGRPHT